MNSSLAELTPPARSILASLVGASGVPRLARSLLIGYLDRLRSGRLSVRFEDGSAATFGRVGEPSARMEIHDPRFYARVAWGGELGFAASFMAGEWSCDDLPALLTLFIANREHLDNLQVSSSWAHRRASRLGHLLRANSLRGSRRNIRDHYDLGNELFATFLDPSMTYSCAVFDEPGASLQQAQLSKLDRMIDLAQIGPDDEVLEIGCGWGSLALRAVERTGCRVTCLTLSESQKTWCEQRISEAGMQDHIRVHLRDYRQEPGRYDRIVSIEMLESVGRENLAVYFERCEDLLRAGGRLALQVITIDDDLYEEYTRGVDFIQRYIFPGGHLPSLAELRRIVATDTDLIWVADHAIGPHYATTLAVWRDRFLARATEIRQQGFDDSFLRSWLYYFGYCEAGFTTGTIDTLQIALERPAVASRLS
jgi:cyclopropane-fatty-acyl-phospholipid synthase